MVFKCKICGGNIELEKGSTVGKCDSCGTKQTLPIIDSDKREKLYDRANNLRRSNDFDSALEVYEQILNDKPDDAEAYWSILLCMYGIEYVEDPYTHERIPTVNRTQVTPIFNNANYKMALKYADIEQQLIYKEEAEKINEIQRGILAISEKVEPYDVFISYKETDANGRRTIDSVLATDLYDKLCKEGFKVFFSKISLEDKIGTAYEPYIFGALKSAKVMIVLGTRPEYFNAVWVRNEWSRFLGFIKVSDGKKILIPVYRDMNVYDLPRELSLLQAQDMSKIGFEQDLIRGIRKYVQVDNNVIQVQQNGYDYGYEQERGRLQAQEDFKREQIRKEEEKKRNEALRKEQEARMEAERIENEKRQLEKELKEKKKTQYLNWLKGTGVVFVIGLIFLAFSAGFGAFVLFVSFAMLCYSTVQYFSDDYSNGANKVNEPPMIKFPKGFEPFQEHDYMEIVSSLMGEGFTNITCTNMHDVILGLFKKAGRVDRILVYGNVISSGGKKYPPDIPIQIFYHGK